MPRSRHSAAPRRSLVLTATLLAVTLGGCTPPGGNSARITEETRVLDTYPFSDPNPIPILATDRRLYPYHTFEGYSATSEPREWKVVKMENDLIEVFILPEVGGKVWGAVVKESGHEFIYRNEVMKFRDIALRGPWTSGGVEFNFGVIGHTPATATPVDYTVRENDDGSVSTFVGAMDLPSRTHWRVEIRLPPDKAYFETHALWYNPTPLEQPYYNWMTAAAFAQDDLEIFVPGGSYLEHPGRERPWPIDEEGRFLPLYRNNAFGGNKSYHVVGELNDFFGGYYHDDDYGWGHWARYEDMPGQKMWLWALSRAGGIWEDLLTDTDGQYVEFQAGRLFVQYQPGDHRNPVTQAGFDPVSASRWTETWFPVEGIGGMTDVSREGAMHVEREGSHFAWRSTDSAMSTPRCKCGPATISWPPCRSTWPRWNLSKPHSRLPPTSPSGWRCRNWISTTAPIPPNGCWTGRSRWIPRRGPPFRRRIGWCSRRGSWPRGAATPRRGGSTKRPPRWSRGIEGRCSAWVPWR